MRGGLGQDIEISSATDEDFMLFLSVERVNHPANGRHGGLPGAPGRIRIDEEGPDLPGKGEFRIKAGQKLVFQTPGGGGFGMPAKREADAVKRDVFEGHVSEEIAKTVYGMKP